MHKSFANAALLLVLVGIAGLASEASADALRFDRDIRPILSEHCLQCHGPDADARKADLRLDDAVAASRVLKPGDSGQSELVRRVLSADAEERMPPPEAKKPL